MVVASQVFAVLSGIADMCGICLAYDTCVALGSPFQVRYHTPSNLTGPNVTLRQALSFAQGECVDGWMFGSDLGQMRRTVSGERECV
ncbi:hypothetical protein HOY80DRAFT_979585 [Tuber brumale]|nr:hypothetical protein HOY80DRAFT_979585 [Tuber brumale]